MDPTPTPEDYAISKIHTVVKRTCGDFQVNVVERAVLVKLNALCRAKMVQLAQRTRHFMENAGRTETHINDVLAAFKMEHVDLKTLIIFSRKCTGIEAAWSRFQFPVPDRKTDHFEAMYGPKPSTRELKIRPENIPSYHRALHPEWIEKEESKSVKKIQTITEEEFQARRASTYPWKESPETQRKRIEKERIQNEAIAYARVRNQERYRMGITEFRDTELPNFEDMEFEEFHEDWEHCRRLEEQARVQEELKEQEKKEAAKEQTVLAERRLPNILQKERRSAILLDQALPLTAFQPRKRPNILAARPKPPQLSLMPAPTPIPIPTTPAPIPTTPNLNPDLTSSPSPDLNSKSSPNLTQSPGPSQIKTPITSTPLSNLDLTPTPTQSQSQIQTPINPTPPQRSLSGRPKKQKAATFDPSPLETPSKLKKTPQALIQSAPTPKLTKFTPPLRAHSGRQKKPRAETFDPSPMPKVKRQDPAQQHKEDVASPEEPEPPIVTKLERDPPQIKLKIKFSSDLLSPKLPEPSSSLETPEISRPPLKLKINLSAIRAKQPTVDVEQKEDSEGKENGDKKEEESIAYCPLCKTTYPDEQLIGCDACGEWFHWQCVGVNEEPTSDTWFCPECVKKRKKKRASTSSKSESTPAKKGRRSKK